MGGGGLFPPAHPLQMRVVCIIKDGPRFVPTFVVQDEKNRRHTFVWSPIYNAHIWNRGELGPEDSDYLEGILSRKENFYRAIVLIRPDEPTQVEFVETPKQKNKGGRPKKVAVAT